MNQSASQKITKELGQSYTITTQIVDRSIRPGAGFYDLNSSFKAVSKNIRGGSMGIRPQLKQQSSTPSNIGPGIYCAKTSLKNYGAMLSKVPAKDFDYKTPVFVGPGAYSKQSTLFQREITIPKTQRAISASAGEQSPGPQSYRLEQYFDKSKKASNAPLMASTRSLNINSNPGPLEYFKNRDIQGIKWKFNTSTQVNKPNIVPGVGTYTLRQEMNQSQGSTCKVRSYGLTY
ncbi:SHIPPO 1-like protein [Spironucleus salmonicida]|uniref:SHIPPO 1-like protein n=1 Tax=Spironucleus salmonicida TaxID=348837 RepID=V6LVU7_9EUKA|nr:SHIPPO 1-like protein [Spironucleus salmonicida]|eukprot:EST48752.1 SHIPPO 1-like protein [Spironucleus salmonicida]